MQTYVQTLGPVQIKASKTQISFGVKRAFAWVWLPQIWTKKRPETSVTLAFALEHPVKDRRIAAAVEARPGLWTHHRVIARSADLDKSTRAWIREAHDLADRKTPAKKAKKQRGN